MANEKIELGKIGGNALSQTRGGTTFLTRYKHPTHPDILLVCSLSHGSKFSTPTSSSTYCTAAGREQIYRVTVDQGLNTNVIHLIPEDFYIVL
jgi:hypothetical protein